MTGNDSKNCDGAQPAAIRKKFVTGGFIVVGVALALNINGCAPVSRFAAQDAENAVEVATAVGDAVGEQCWPALAETAKAINAVGSTTGLLTAIEEKRAIQMALRSPACAPIWAGVLAEVLKLTPAAPFVP